MTTATVTDQTVLVTGGAGFIGSHLVDALVTENDVRILDHFSTHSPSDCNEAATVIEGDVRDGEVVERAMSGIDTVFHLAAVSVERSVAAPVENHAVNASATLDLLERARDENARVVFASSAAIYGSPDRVPIREADRKRPVSPHGVAKLTADHYVRLYHDLYGIDTVALRYFNVYGPHHSDRDRGNVVDAFLERARTDEPLTIYGDGTQTRDFVHVRDVVAANLFAATTDRVGEAFNVGSGEATTIEELAERVCEVTGSSSRIDHAETRAGDIEHSCADISNARRNLGFDPAVSLMDGLRELERGSLG